MKPFTCAWRAVFPDPRHPGQEKTYQCTSEAETCTLHGGIVDQAFCGVHGPEKFKQGVPLYLLTPDAVHGGEPFLRVSGFVIPGDHRSP